jgi:hypothetical protein
VIDLFRVPNKKGFKPPLSSKITSKQNLKEGELSIVSAANGCTLPGQTWIDLPCESDIFMATFLSQIKMSTEKRVFKDNSKNDRSSRSHHIFQIKISQKDKLGKEKESLLNIVDLAGSERRESPYA